MRRLFFLFSFFLSTLEAADLVSSVLSYTMQSHIESLPCKERFPVTFNNIFSLGYFVTPSARMACIGEAGVGYAHTPPYQGVIARVQPFHHLDFSYIYRIFEENDDNVSSGNFKLAVTLPEESCYSLPGIALGIESAAGSEIFRNYFIVGTQVVKKLGLEASLGWGAGSYTHGPSNGWFGGFAYYPFWKNGGTFFKGLAFSAEYDPQNLSKDPNLADIPSHVPVNYGVKYTLFDTFQFTAAQLRGSEFEATAVASFQLGAWDGLFRKKYDPPCYDSPINQHPLGCFRPEEAFIHELRFTLCKQGIVVKKAWFKTCDPSTLYIQLENCSWRSEREFRKRLACVLKAQKPENLLRVVVILEAHTLPVQEYHYIDEELYCREDVSLSNYQNCRSLISYPPDSLNYSFIPIYNTFFGSEKFLYDIRLNASFWGDLPYHLYYGWGLNWSAISNIGNIAPGEFNAPTPTPIVASDLVRYFQVHAITWNNLYLQKFWNFGNAFFGSLTGGYFQVNYAGVGAEFIYYPAHGQWGIGVEGAVTRKRSYRGLGFQDALVKWNGSAFEEISYTSLNQAFFDLYLNLPRFKVFTKWSVGQFLAGDFGGYAEAVKYFDNGLRLGGFITVSNAMGGEEGGDFYNRGIILEIPFDFFLQKSCRPTYTYSSATWLRDAGYRTSTGLPLFDIVERERRP